MRNVDRALQVTILRKEKIVLIFASPAMRERVLSELLECTEFASAGKCLSGVLLRVELISMKPVHTSSKHPLPPMPTLNGIPRPQIAPDGLPSSQTAPDLRQSNAPP